VLSHDLENDPDVVAMIAASAALTLVWHSVMGPIERRASAASRANTSSTRRSTR